MISFQITVISQAGLGYHNLPKSSLRDFFIKARSTYDVIADLLAWLIWQCHLCLGIAKQRANMRVFLSLCYFMIDSSGKPYA